MKTVRRRSGQAFVGLRASLTRGDLDEQAQAIAEAYLQWESQPRSLANGTRMSSGYVLWLPKSRLVQLSTDGVMPGDAPPLREPLPPDLDLRALRDDIDQPPIVADPLSPDHRRLRNAGPPRKKITTQRHTWLYGAGAQSDLTVSRSRPCDDRLASVPSVRWRINGTKL